MTDHGCAGDERFLVLAPTGRDGPLTSELLATAELDALVCGDVAEACDRLDREGAAGLLIAEEILVPATAASLGAVLARQPPWSDLPVLLFTGRAASPRAARPTARILAALGNVTLLDRPLRPITMVSAARAALRARRRQYAARRELIEQQRAVRQRDQFLAMLGHELRNPLSAILMAVEVMDRGGDPARLRAVVKRQAVHLGRLVDDLLDVARVTSGKIVLQTGAVELGELVERCLQASAASIERHGLALRYQRPAEAVVVEGDAVRLEQVVANVVTNAVKYTPPRGRLELAVARDGGEAVVRVADTGVGIAPDMLERVFDLFAQVDGSLDRADGGMGIGLTLVRSLVELHGGRVAVDSPGLGQGTTFTIRLPLAARREGHADAGAAGAADRAARYDVLVVEDNPDSREMLQLFVAGLGHRAATAADGVAAVDQALRQRPDVMLVDIGLPGLDGYEVARRVRAALGRAVYLVALTGYGQPDDRRRAIDAGFDVHHTKPADLAALQRLLGRGDLGRPC